MPTRALNIALRTAHLGAMAVLVGGHAFDVAPERLGVALGFTMGTGIVLVVVEAEGRLLWLYQLRGILTVVKLVLLAVVPLLWEGRFLVLLAVLALGAVGAHMPARYRHYSVLHRRVVPHGCGPGVGRLRREGEAQDP